MSGKRKKDNKIGTFLAVIIFAGAIFWYIRATPSEYSFTSLFDNHDANSLSIVVVGDIMLDRNVRNKINQVGFGEFFKGVEPLISEADIAVGNLEGPFTIYPSITSSLKNKALQFTFDPTLAIEMSALGFDVLGLANNHTLNFGTEGLKMTREYIKNAGMLYYGEPDNRDELSTVVEKNGIKVGFVGFHEFSYINYDKVFV